MLIWLRAPKFVDNDLSGVGIDGNVIRREDCAKLTSLDEGFAMLDKARRGLDEERAAAQEQMQEEAQQIYARALKEGEEQGRQLALQEWYERTLGAFADYRAIQKRMRERLAELIASAVEQIVQVEDSKALFLRALSSLDQIAEGASFLTVSVNRNDFAKAQQVFDEFANEWGRRGQPIKIIVHADKDLPAGSCICESEFGIVDASLHTQIQAMRAALERALAKEMSEKTSDKEQSTPSEADKFEIEDETLATVTKAKTRKTTKSESATKTTSKSKSTTKSKSGTARAKLNLNAEEKPKSKRKTKSASKAAEIDVKENA